MIEEEKFTPRNYQVELMKIALKQNTIIYLPTGSGKTFIAIMVLKSMSKCLLRSYSEGGKISLILVNTVALVDQHAKYINDHTIFSVGCYSGEMNLDMWKKEQWITEFNKYQVLIMTSQILLNNINNNFIDLTKVNLIIFDECHRGVEDQPMRQIMKTFQNYNIQPRVLGLTATLLNRNCKIINVMDEVRSLEVTYHSKVATIDELVHVVGHSTNPQEGFEYHEKYICSEVDLLVLANLNKLIHNLKSVRLVESTTPSVKLAAKPLNADDGLKKLINLIKDLYEHIEVLGTFGGYKACISHMIQVERLIKHCQDITLYNILKYVQTEFGWCMERFKSVMKSYNGKDKIYKLSSDKILKLLQIFKDYKYKSKEELCALVFTQKRFTAKIIHHIFQNILIVDSEFSHIKSNFVVGYNNNPFNDTREGLFISKKNKEILNSFINKEINVLVSSNVLEEGVDIPKCTLVVKFDKSLEYRSYIQSKGRARHKSSLYYTIVELENRDKFGKKIQEYREIERKLNDFLVGKNLDRCEPSETELDEMYNEEFLKPYFTNGPNSAQVNMLSAIPLLCQYCSSLPCDKYTIYAPEWYIEDKIVDMSKKYRVIIVLPIICPIVDPIYGPFVNNKKIAKRAAALYACVALHKHGELDDDLLPSKAALTIQDSNFLFTHWPEVKEKDAGFSKKKRLHKKEIPMCLKGSIAANEMVYLHLIELKPCFYPKTDDLNQSTIYNMYTSSTCYGILTPNALPKLCDFPIYESNGTVDVQIHMNVKMLILTPEQLIELREFHFLIFDELLEIVKPFMVFDNKGNSSEMMLIVPIQRSDDINIDFNIVQDHKSLKNKYIEPSAQDRINIDVDEESYLHKIISPWYRSEASMYIITRVFMDKSPLSAFPNDDYSNFSVYYDEKHNLKILNPNQPLVLVKGISRRLNLYKPSGRDSKKKKEKKYDLEEFLIPELIVKQEFPATLWIQGRCLPTILSRVAFLLRIQQLQMKIASEANFQIDLLKNHSSLELDEHLLSYVPLCEENTKSSVAPYTTIDDISLPLESSTFVTQTYNKDFAMKMLESEYPWRSIDEPKDIERELDVSVMDIEHYETFVQQTVKQNTRLLKNEYQSLIKPLPAITYEKDYVQKPIEMLFQQSSYQSPNLFEMYEALTTSKANDIVNLERLETLGDSFLKYISSIYIMLRFPQYNEGRSTSLKSKLVSNKNLYYLAVQKNFGGILKNNDFAPKTEWLPPSFHVPDLIRNKISKKELSINSLFNIDIPPEEQISGNLSKSTVRMLNENVNSESVDEDEENSYSSMSEFLNDQYVGDKTIADVVEALLGLYFKNAGIAGGIKFCEWLNIIPASENLQNLLKAEPPNPILNKDVTLANIDFHLPQWEEFEKRLGYHFNNRAYLLQALTHATYTPNRITHCYQRLEFLGDAVLDFLITCHIYESCGKLNPGEVTDLRSALVNNNTFASFVVRCGFHKFLLMINVQLQGFIDKFAEYLAIKNYVIDDEVLILLEENDLNIAEYVDVPKILGDIFEALAGAVYLDSGKNLQTVWKVFHKIMWREIDLFSNNIPRNVIRRLYECHTSYPTFSKTCEVGTGKVMVCLEFMCDGRKKRVHGFGTNKHMAKRAAAKIALRSLEK